MSRYTGSRNKLARQIGEDLSLKTNALKVGRRINIRPGQHGAKRRRKLSDYGIQLREKQKIRYVYGVSEKQLQRLYQQATKSQLATGSTLISYLERRLDNVVFRLGWAPTRAAARQLVSHYHVRLNGKKHNVASYQVQINDALVLSTKASKIPAIKAMLESDAVQPEWLEKKQVAARVVRLPVRSDVIEPVVEQLVVEYYSR
ncbi:MAG: 30S ribosomal protein S4 [Candidatus Pacebacteria bacterium]|nr:30S ribosomal protein S4 [Candidatus Paceibacterota bacterium]PIR60506.1 MAG: 30S ribosomal protein S4 [Candidatus Pacebacteria bacterium CG10_big_fil_rev_8_21_14_0_10_44_54]